MVMRYLFRICLFASFGLFVAGNAFAQETGPKDGKPAQPQHNEKPLKENPLQDEPPIAPPLPELPDIAKPEVKPKAPEDRRDLTVRSEADRQIFLKDLFAELKAAKSEEDAKLIAEEIWAVFLQSRSASVDFVLLRGISAENRGDLKLARRMYDHVTRLAPDFAEGWSRSARLAITERNFNRAVEENIKALNLEPRHFYALWTLGNILETLERPNDAYEAYVEALRIYPLHPEIKARVKALEKNAKGQAL